MEYQEILSLVDKNVRLQSNILEKEDLISDIYLYIAESDQELTEKNILQFLKSKYSAYTELYDIRDEKSYDKYDRLPAAQEVTASSAKDAVIYEYFEKILYGRGVVCNKCGSKEVYPKPQSLRLHRCRDCGSSFSFDENTNLEGVGVNKLKNIIKFYTLLLDGKVSFDGFTKREYNDALYHTLPTIINNKPLIEKVPTVTLPEKVKSPKKFKEYPHQTEAIAKAVEHFKTHDRGKIIHPCGSGKTYTSIQIVKKLDIKRLIVVVPSRILLYQQLKSFKEQLVDHKFYAFGQLSIGDLKGIKVLGSCVTEQKANIRLIRCEKVVVFTTIHSFQEITKELENFDLAIFDEGHRIAGPEHKKWLSVLDSDKYHKALFLTATEKVFDNSGVGMDDRRFGGIIHRSTIPEMVKSKVICDYKIINVGFTDEKIKKLVEENEHFFVNENIKFPIKSRILISALSLIKCIEKYKISKVITYHATIKEAIIFAEVYKKFQKEYGLDYDIFTINSRQSDNIFSKNLDGFTYSKKAIVSSVNCFQEGIDVVDVDAVLYGYPKSSKIDIVQSIGRTMRKSRGKKHGFVIIPNIDRDFKKLTDALDALSFCDTRIVEMYTGSSKNLNYSSNIEFLEDFKKIDLFNDKIFYPFLSILKRKKLSVVDMKKWMMTNKPNIKTSKEYLKWAEFRDFPLFLYRRPPQSYGKEWRGWSYVFGEKTRRSTKSEFMSFEDAKNWMKSNGIKTYKDWVNLEEKPINIRSHLNLYKEWTSAYDFFEYDIKTVNKSDKIDYQKAKNILKNLDIKSRNDYLIKYNNGELPKKLPKYPKEAYQRIGSWVSWRDFLSLSHRDTFSYDNMFIYTIKNEKD